MKILRLLTITALILAVSSAGVFAEDTVVKDDKAVHQLSPQIEAMGGAFVPIARGYEALFTNPAGLSRKGGQLTFLNVNLGPYFVPTEEMISIAEEMASEENGEMDQEKIKELLETLELKKGVGTDLNMGFGFAAYGIGLGVLTDVDLFLIQEGETISTTRVDPVITTSAVAGLSHGFDFGDSRFIVGGDVRGVLRARKPGGINLQTVLDMMDDSESGSSEASDPMTWDLDVSVGYGFDAGAIFELPSGFTLGGVVQNIGGTRLVTANKTGNELQTALDTHGADVNALYDDVFGEPISGFEYVIPMSITGGVGYDTPDKEALDLRFAAEYTHTFYQEQENIDNDTFWKNVHLGGEVSLLRFLKVRGGFNQGYLTAGVGLNLFVIELDATYYSRELGNYAGHRQNEALVIGTKIKL
jgi:hypothetical protein